MTYDTLIAAAVQAAPVFLDREGTVAKAAGLIAEAAADGARLVAFPEAFVPTYPDWVWRTLPWTDGPADWYERLLDQSVTIPGVATHQLGKAARTAGVYVSIGVNELAGTTLYNTQLWLGPDGGMDVLVAPTWDNSDMWVPTMRHIAKEGRIHVIGVAHCLRGSDVPDAIPGRDELYGGDTIGSRAATAASPVPTAICSPARWKASRGSCWRRSTSTARGRHGDSSTRLATTPDPTSSSSTSIAAPHPLPPLSTTIRRPRIRRGTVATLRG